MNPDLSFALLLMSTSLAAMVAATGILFAGFRISAAIHRAKLRRNVRAWLPAAIKKGPRSVEWDFVAKWSFELRMLEIR